MNMIRPSRLLVALAMLLVTPVLSGCWPFPQPNLRDLAPDAEITSATASRDEVADEPMVTISYRVLYPSTAYAASLPGGVATLNCEMSQARVTESSKIIKFRPVTVVGTDRGPYSGTEVLAVPLERKFISGSWSLTCILRSDRDLVTTAPVSVDIPKPDCGRPPAPPLGNFRSQSPPSDSSCGATTSTGSATATNPPDSDQYFVFVLPEVSGGSIVVTQESALKQAATCSFSGGGLCQGNDPPVSYRKVSEGFATLDAATTKWCSDLAGATVTNSPVAGDSHATVYGGDYWIGTAPGCS